MFCYEAFYRDIGFDYYGGGCFFRNDRYRGWVSLARSMEDPRFNPSEVEDFGVTLRHLHRAFQVNTLLSDARETSSLVLNALDRVEAGVVLLSVDGRVQHHNQRAQPYLSGGRWPGNRKELVFPEARANAELGKLMKRAQRGPGGSLPESSAFAFYDRSGERVMVACFPVTATEEQSDWLSTRASTIVFILSPSRGTIIPEQWLRDLFGLTAAETHVVQGLLKSATTAEIAEELEVGREAVRFHLKNIFSKTGVRRQSELVSLVLSGLGKIAPPPA